MKNLNINSALLTFLLALIGYYGHRLESKVDVLNESVVSLRLSGQATEERMQRAEQELTKMYAELSRLRQRAVTTRPQP